MLGKVLSKKSDHLFSEMVRYSISGATAFVVDVSILYTLTEWFHLYYLISAALGFTFGTFTVYILSISWVFPVRAFDSHQKEFLVFALIGAVGLGFNELLIWTFTDFLHFYYLISKAFAAALVYTWNFTSRKWLLFSKQKGKG